jgi:hypothetical protein
MLGSVCEGVPADDGEKQLVVAIECNLTQFASAPKSLPDTVINVAWT